MYICTKASKKMTRQEAPKIDYRKQQAEAAVEAHWLSQRWESQAEATAAEIAEDYLKDLRSFLAGRTPRFKAYFMLHEGHYGLVHDYFLPGLNQLSCELEAGPLNNSEDDSDIELLRTPEGILYRKLTTYSDGNICGVEYSGVRTSELQTEPQNMVTPHSAILGTCISVEVAASL
jgi:hypothetical protein